MGTSDLFSMGRNTYYRTPLHSMAQLFCNAHLRKKGGPIQHTTTSNARTSVKDEIIHDKIVGDYCKKSLVSI